MFLGSMANLRSNLCVGFALAGVALLIDLVKILISISSAYVLI